MSVTYLLFQADLKEIKDGHRRFQTSSSTDTKKKCICKIVIKEISSLALWYSLSDEKCILIRQHYNITNSHLEKLINRHPRIPSCLHSFQTRPEESVGYTERFNYVKNRQAEWNFNLEYYKKEEDRLKELKVKDSDFITIQGEYNDAIAFLDSTKYRWTRENAILYTEVAFLLAKGNKRRLGNDSLLRSLNTVPLVLIMKHFMALFIE